jgi:pSer/pThr/pTyr-binding forkhead associated (FHA) protein
MEKAFSIGRADKNHLEVDDESVSPQHARIQNLGDSFLLKDLGSSHGTFVNGQRITQKNIVCGDIITIGSIDLVVVDPVEAQNQSHYWSLIADSGWLTGQEFPIIGDVGQVISIGRGNKCDIVFPGSHLSREHARVTVGQSSLTLQDLNSANGTFVNDDKITETEVYAGDKVRLDVYSFRVFGPGIKLPKSARSGVRLSDSQDSTKTDNTTRQWKSKPTSPGNREEINLYKKQHRQLILVGGVIAGVLGVATYVVLGVLGII